MDTIGTEESVLIREVSSFQRLNYMLENCVWGKKRCPYVLERCPYFGGVLKRGVPLYCVYMYGQVLTLLSFPPAVAHTIGLGASQEEVLLIHLRLVRQCVTPTHNNSEL